MNSELIIKGVESILDGITDDLDIDWRTDPNFEETPERVARAYQEILSGVDSTGAQIKNALSKSFPSKYNNIIFSSGIETVSMCPHHLFLVKYKIAVGYIPAKNGKVIGASKLARVAAILSARPVLQEDLTFDISKALKNKINPMGVAVVISGRHDCLNTRGVKQSNATFETSSMTGIFRTQAETRAEFFSLLADSRGTK